MIFSALFYFLAPEIRPRSKTPKLFHSKVEQLLDLPIIRISDDIIDVLRRIYGKTTI
jgi:hypothetical protein